MNETPTPRLVDIDPKTRSILPTGSVKISGGAIIHEAEVIVHHPCEIRTAVGVQAFEIGVYMLWFESPQTETTKEES